MIYTVTGEPVKIVKGSLEDLKAKVQYDDGEQRIKPLEELKADKGMNEIIEEVKKG